MRNSSPRVLSCFYRPPLTTEYAFHFFFFNETPTTEIYTLSLHDALPISVAHPEAGKDLGEPGQLLEGEQLRSEEHTSELQSRRDLVCRLLLEKKKK